MGCMGSSQAREVPFSLDAKAAESDVKLFHEVQEVVDQSRAVYQAVEDYTGCRELVRQAMSTPSRENEQLAFEGLLKAVDSIAMFYDFSNQLSRVMPSILNLLTTPAADGAHPLSAHQAIGAQLVQLLDFTIRFDQVRMMRPNLSNDFSYYRRLLPKFSKHPDVKVKDDDASGMALFTAEHIPMMSTLSKATKGWVDVQGVRGEAASFLLATFANTCMGIARRKLDEQTTWLCLRAMTGAIVLHDHITGAVFLRRNNGIATRDCILLLKRDFSGKAEVDPLLNCIRYSTVSFSTAPSSITELFD